MSTEARAPALHGYCGWKSPLPLPLLKHVFHFAQKRLQQRLVVHLGERVQLLQQFFLAFVQLCGNLHSHFDVEIALASPIHDRHTFVADAERGIRLRALWNLQRVLAVHGRHADLRSHCSLRN